MADYISSYTPPEPRKVKEAEPVKKETSMFDGLGGKISDTFRDIVGTNKTVPFGQLPK